MAGFTDEQLWAAVDAYRAYGTKQAAADALGMAVSTYKDRLSAAARKGMMGVEPALPGFAITNTTAFLDGKEKVVRQVIQQKPDNEERTTVDPLGARVDDARTGMAGRIAHG